MWYALGPGCSAPYVDTLPTGMFRFETLAEHPVAAALHFSDVLNSVIKFVIGWDKKKRGPFKRGGVWGVARGYILSVEEQARLTLHAHCLIWLPGHENIEQLLKKKHKNR